MKTAAIAVLLSLSAFGVHAADTCVAQAAAKNLAGAAKASFVKKCTADAVAVSRTSCDEQAVDKKLAGAAKTSFTKKCVTDTTPDVQSTCNAVADDKKLAGAARDSNLTKCVKDFVEPSALGAPALAQ